MRTIEDGAPGNDHVRPQLSDLGDVRPCDPAVDADEDGPAVGRDHGADLLDASLGPGSETLTAPAGVDGQDEHVVEVVEQRFEHLQRRPRTDRKAPDDPLRGVVRVGGVP